MKPILLLLLASPALAGDVAIDGHTFRVPDGFTVEKVAGPPLVNRPIVADFDERGRLYVADSSGSNEAPDKQLANPTHRIVRLEDTDGDGKYDKSIVFADKMMFPEGAMWRDGSLYVAAPPSIWKLTDTDGDGICDKREEWFKGKTLTGCANDLHGPYNGPDGWIYWCKGAFAEQTYTLPNGKPFKTRAAHIFRAKPDGSNIEPVITGGMDNPVEIAWSPGGEMFFTSTFVQHPGGGKRDGIVHGVYGGVYGKDHDVLDGHIRTGPDLMPIMTHLGPAAPSGLMCNQSLSLGREYYGNLFAAQFNLHKVSRHQLYQDGASYKTKDFDFLTVADNHDFHPTDVLEDADGSILVLDTGGWYKLCCPTSQIGKPDVLGAIYRVRRIDAKKVADPRGEKLDWSNLRPQDLVKLLDDERPVVRRRAIATLAKLGDRAVKALDEGMEEGVWSVEAAWVLSRIDTEAATELTLRMISSINMEVIRVACRVLDLKHKRTEDVVRTINEALVAQRTIQESGSFVVQAAGRLGDESTIALLVKLKLMGGFLLQRTDRHAIIYALIEINKPDALADALKDADEDGALCLMVALDQLGRAVPIEKLSKALRHENADAREIAEWIVANHPAYADAIAPTLASRLDQEKIAPAELAVLEGQLARFSKSPKIRDLISGSIIANGFRSPEARHALRLIALRAAARSGLRTLPDGWREGLTLALASDDADEVKQAIATARALPSTKGSDLASALRKIVHREGISSSLRLDALSSLPDGPGTISESLFKFLRTQLDPALPVATRLAAAGVLAKAKLSTDQLGALAESLKTAGPLDAADLLPAFDHTTDDAIGRKIVASLKDSPALTSLRVEALKPRFAKFGKPVQNDAESLYTVIDKSQADQRGKLDDLAKTIPQGDVRRGQAVFNSTKAACLSCHAIGYVGGTVGPDLSVIGKIRNDRDLLESIVFPSASFVRSYEPMIVATKGGIVHSGVLKKDAPDEVVLATGPDKEARIPRADVEEMKPGTVSVMPSGLDSQMSRQELADLIAFLKSRK